MHFSKVYLTSNGYAALSSAAAGSTSTSENASKIIWGEAYTSNVDIRNEAEWTQERINSATKGDFPSSTYTSHGIVTDVSTGLYPPSEDIQYETATLTIEVTNGSESGGAYQYNGNAYTLCVLGKKEDDAEYELFIIASIGHNDNPEPVSSTQPFKAILNCHIQLSHDITNAVMAADNWYAPAAAFNDLKLRAVTTHIDGNDSVGEDQTIRGVKTFVNDTYFSSKVLPNGNSYIGDNTANGRWDTVYATTFDGTAFTGTANKAICDNNGNTISSYYCTVSTDQSISGIKIFDSDVYSRSCIHALGDIKTAGLRLCDALAHEQYAYCAITGTEDQHNSTMTFHFVNAVDDLEYRVRWSGPNTDTYGNETLTTTPMTSGTWSLGNDTARLGSIYATDVYATNFYGNFTRDTANSVYGIIEDGSSGPFYNGSCINPGIARTVTSIGFSLTPGAVITILFAYSNSSESTTLNVNSTGDKNIEAGSDTISWTANSLKTFKYTGSKWRAIKVDSISNYGVCSTASSVAAKVVTISNRSFRLCIGARVIVRFSSSNIASSPTLNVNDTGAKPIIIWGSETPGTTVIDSWASGETHEFVYDGTNWRCVNYQYYSQSTAQVALLGSNSNSNLPLLFASGYNSDTTVKSSKEVYTDTDGSFYYNPSINQLHVRNLALSGGIASPVLPYTPTVNYNIGESNNRWYYLYCKNIDCIGSVTCSSISTSDLSSSKRAIADVLADYNGRYWGCDNVGAIGLFLYKGYKSGSSLSYSTAGSVVPGSSLRRISIEMKNDYTFPASADSPDSLDLSDFKAAFISDNSTNQSPSITGSWVILNYALKTNNSSARTFRPNIVLAIKVLD